MKAINISVPTTVQISTSKHKKYERQGNATPPEVCNSLVTSTKDMKVDEMPDKEFKNCF
jgi:hypothetical protein